MPPFGCVVDSVTGDVWITNNGRNRNRMVVHLKNDGTLLGTVPVGDHLSPYGVSIDRSGKIWVINYLPSNVMRIDPDLNGGIGAVDLTIPLSQYAHPSSISDVTGSTLTGRQSMGTWTITHDSGVVGQTWGNVTWIASTPADSTLTVQARSSIDRITYSAWQPVTKFVDLTMPDGRYLQVRVTFKRATTTARESPTLYDLSISAAF